MQRKLSRHRQAGASRPQPAIVHISPAPRPPQAAARPAARRSEPAGNVVAMTTTLTARSPRTCWPPSPSCSGSPRRVPRDAHLRRRAASMPGSTCRRPARDDLPELVDSLLSPAWPTGRPGRVGHLHRRRPPLGGAAGARRCARLSAGRHRRDRRAARRRRALVARPRRAGRAASRRPRRTTTRTHPFAAQAVFDGRVPTPAARSCGARWRRDPTRWPGSRPCQAAPPHRAARGSLGGAPGRPLVGDREPPDDHEAAGLLRASLAPTSATRLCRRDRATQRGHLESGRTCCAGPPTPGARRRRPCSRSRLAGRARRARLVRARPLLRGRPRPPRWASCLAECLTRAVPPRPGTGGAAAGPDREDDR